MTRSRNQGKSEKAEKLAKQGKVEKVGRSEKVEKAALRLQHQQHRQHKAMSYKMAQRMILNAAAVVAKVGLAAAVAPLRLPVRRLHLLRHHYHSAVKQNAGLHALTKKRVTNASSSQALTNSQVFANPDYKDSPAFTT
jgi:hypothetical protein